MNKEQRKKEIERLRSIGKSGGNSTVKRHGVEYMRELAAKGGEATRKRWKK